MPLNDVTLHREGRHEPFDEPNGEIVEVLRCTKKRLKLLVRVEDICGEEMSDGSICDRDPDECQYHSEE